MDIFFAQQSRNSTNEESETATDIFSNVSSPATALGLYSCDNGLIAFYSSSDLPKIHDPARILSLKLDRDMGIRSIET